VRAQLFAGILKVLRHLVDVEFESVQIDEQGGGVDLIARQADDGVLAGHYRSPSDDGFRMLASE
jgi:hypothetical protein